MDRVADRETLTTYGAYKFYLDSNISKKYRVESRSEFTKILKYIFKVTSIYIVEKSGGAVLDGIGYFTNWVTPRKVVFKRYGKNGFKLNPNYHTDNYFYNTALFTNISRKNRLDGWYMDKMFNKNIKVGVGKKLISGFKYKFYFSLLKNIYKS